MYWIQDAHTNSAKSMADFVNKIPKMCLAEQIIKSYISTCCQNLFSEVVNVFCQLCDRMYADGGSARIISWHGIDSQFVSISSK